MLADADANDVDVDVDAAQEISARLDGFKIHEFFWKIIEGSSLVMNDKKQCPICGVTYDTGKHVPEREEEAAREDHRQRHPYFFDFISPEANCGRAFTSSMQMEDHGQTEHNPDNPYYGSLTAREVMRTTRETFEKRVDLREQQARPSLAELDARIADYEQKTADMGDPAKHLAEAGIEAMENGDKQPAADLLRKVDLEVLPIFAEPLYTTIKGRVPEGDQKLANDRIDFLGARYNVLHTLAVSVHLVSRS